MVEEFFEFSTSKMHKNERKSIIFKYKFAIVEGNFEFSTSKMHKNERKLMIYE